MSTNLSNNRSVATSIHCVLIALVLSVILTSGHATAEDSEPISRQQILVVVGAPGSPEYGEQFSSWADRWKSVAKNSDASYLELGRQDANGTSDKDSLQKTLVELKGSDERETWIVLIGHGTFQRDVAKFNLRGPDISAKEFAEWLKPFGKPLIVINCASSSSPFINRLSGKNRTIVAATKSGNESNFARFGDYLSAAVGDIAADLDHDDEVSLLEAFLSASGQVEQFYESDNRLATEHALIDDNGDALGTSANFFRGARAIKSAKKGASLDGRGLARTGIFRSEKALVLNSDQLQQRNEIEKKIDVLRDQKSKLNVDEYYSRLEPLVLQLAELYEAAGKARP